MTTTQVEKQIDVQEYEKLLNQNQSTFYHTYNHLNFLSDMLELKPNFITIRKEKELVGLLPFFLKDSKEGQVINSLPFFGSYGGFVCDLVENQRLILDEMNNYNKENDVLSSVIIDNPFSNNKEIFEKNYNHNFKEERLCQCIVLNNNEEDLWNKFEQRVRRAVRKSQKNDLISKLVEPDDELFENFFQMHKNEMESKNGNPKPEKFFNSVKKNFSYNKDYEIFSAEKDGKSIAYLLLFYSYPYVEYYMPAYDSTLKNLQGTSILIWESIKSAINKKMQFYNFGGTWKTQSELYLYKRGWNSKDFFYNYYVYGDIDRAKKIGLEEIKKNYPFFYVFSYSDLETNL